MATKVYNGNALLGTINANPDTSVAEVTRLLVENKFLHPVHIDPEEISKAKQLGLGLVEHRIVPSTKHSGRMDFCIYQENSLHKYGRLLMLEYT